jgi:PAS domain-containing protein
LQASKTITMKFGVAFKVSFVYIFIGLLYIFVSDKMLNYLLTDQTYLTQLQTYKGFIFVCSTGVLLYLMVRAYENKTANLLTQLKRQNSRLKLALDSGKQGFCQLDLKNQSVFGNDYFKAYFGIDDKESVYSWSRVSNKIHPDDLPEFEEFLTDAKSVKKTDSLNKRFEMRIQTPNKTYKWFLCNAYYSTENNVVLSTLIDINHIKQIEEGLVSQNEKLVSISQFNSHRLRAPLSNILGLITLLEETKDESLYPLLKQSAEDLDTVIHDINTIIHKNKA